MSEKIYACLLRVCPSSFREAYGEEALQLFRDRWREETGFVGRLRLWLDLFADLLVSLPRMRRRLGAALIGATQPIGGRPYFYIVQDESLGPGTMLLAGILSLAAFTV